MPPRTVAFRCDASVAIGTGHLARCGALALAMNQRGASVHFLCNSAAQYFLFGVRNYPINFVFSDEDEDLRRHVTSIAPDIIVFDHYGLDCAYEARYRGSSTTLVAIDDIKRRHDVDLLVNPMPGAQTSDVIDLAPNGCEVRCGAEWLLLRPEIGRLRPYSIERRRDLRDLRRVFICMGGADPLGHVMAALAAVEASGVDAKIDLAVGRRSPAMEAVRDFIRGSPLDIELHVDTQQTAELMAEADIAIGAGGVMAWERCALGLPSVTLIIADNQQEALPFLAKTEASFAFDGRTTLSVDEIAEAFAGLARDGLARAEMSERAAAVCDARGADRLADVLAARRTP